MKGKKKRENHKKEIKTNNKKTRIKPTGEAIEKIQNNSRHPSGHASSKLSNLGEARFLAPRSSVAAGPAKPAPKVNS